jgi:hypothetical protein
MFSGPDVNLESPKSHTLTAKFLSTYRCRGRGRGCGRGRGRGRGRGG